MAYFDRLNKFKLEHESDIYWIFDIESYNNIPITTRIELYKRCSFKDFKLIGNVKTIPPTVEYVALFFHFDMMKQLAETTFPELVKLLK